MQQLWRRLEDRNDGVGSRWEAAQVEVDRLRLPCTMSLYVLEGDTGAMGVGSPASAQAVECVAMVLQGCGHESLTQHGSQDGKVTGDGVERPVVRRSGSLTVTPGGRAWT